MNYKIVYLKEALLGIKKLRCDKSASAKLKIIISELEIHPTIGEGQPKQLKHGLSGCWSRRITHKHRIVYEIHEEIVTVAILSSHGHYDGK